MPPETQPPLSPAQPPKPQGRYPAKLERFDVVLIKSDVGPHDAPADAFRRVPVEADGPLGAQLHEDVDKAKAEAPGYRFMFVMPPGVMSDPELRARQVAMAPQHRQDPTKVRYR